MSSYFFKINLRRELQVCEESRGTIVLYTVIFPKGPGRQIAISDDHNCIYFRKRAAVPARAIDRAIDHAYLLAALSPSRLSLPILHRCCF